MTDTQPGTAAQRQLTVVTMPAEIDATNANDVAARLASALAPGIATVIADMTATTFCDSAGIRALILTSKHAAASSIELRLLGPNPRILKILAIQGADKLLPLYPGPVR